MYVGEISDFVTVIKLKKEDDIKSTFQGGELFKYEKRGNKKCNTYAKTIRNYGNII